MSRYIQDSTGKMAGSIGDGKNKTPTPGLTPTVLRTTKSKVRHETTPHPNGCRWCGQNLGEHGQSWIASVGFHEWTTPTPKQRLARMLANYKQNTGKEYTPPGAKNG